MHNPPHPGEVIKALCLEPLGSVTVTQAAQALGVSRKTLSAILNGRAKDQPRRMASSGPSIAFDTSAEGFGSISKRSTDLWHAEQGREAPPGCEAATA